MVHNVDKGILIKELSVVGKAGIDSVWIGC